MQYIFKNNFILFKQYPPPKWGIVNNHENNSSLTNSSLRYKGNTFLVIRKKKNKFVNIILCITFV